MSPLTERTNTRPQAILGLRGGCPLLEGGGVTPFTGRSHICWEGHPLQGRKQGHPFYREKLQVKLTFSTANHVKEKT